MVTFAQALYQRITLVYIRRLRARRRLWCRMFRGLFHLLSEAQRTHINPYRLDVVQAFLLETAFAHILPAEGIVTVSWPDRVLLFVIDHDFVDRGIFLVVSLHHRHYDLLSVDRVNTGSGTGCRGIKARSCCKIFDAKM